MIFRWNEIIWHRTNQQIKTNAQKQQQRQWTCKNIEINDKNQQHEIPNGVLMLSLSMFLPALHEIWHAKKKKKKKEQKKNSTWF